MKALKIFFGSMLILLLLAASAIIMLLWWVNPNDYKQEIEQLAAKQNVVLKIEEDLDWSFYPSLGIRSGKLMVQPPMGALATPIAFDSLRIGLKLIPLLLKQEVHASVVEVRGGGLTLKSADTKDLTEVRNLNLTVHDLNLQQQPFALDVALEMESQNNGRVNQRITLEGSLRLVLDNTLRKVQIHQGRHEITFSGNALPQTAKISLDVSGALDLEQSLADFPDVALKVDDTALKGNIKAAYGEKPYYQVNLKGDQINLDRYSQKVVAPEDNKIDSTSGKNIAPEPLIPASLILAFPGEYRLAFYEMIVSHLKLSDFSLALDIHRDGVAVVKPLTLQLYEGALALDATVDVRGSRPVVKTRFSLSPLQLEPALKDFFQVEKAFAMGDIAIDAEVITRGQLIEDFIKALEGNFTVTSKTIALKEVDLTSSLDASLLQLLQTRLPQLASSDNKTVMTDLNGSGLIQQGVIKPLITAKALCTEFKIQGDYDLPASKVDMQTGITFPSSDKTEACTEINPRLKDIAWPVICRGSVADAPAKLCRADTEKMQSILAKAATKEAGEKLEKKLDEKLKKKLGAESDQIKDAFKGLLR